MSEQPSTMSTFPHPEAVGTRWGDPISGERRAELKVLVDRQREWAALPESERKDSAFKDSALNGADVFWLAVQALAGPDAEEARLAAGAEYLLTADRERLRVELDLRSLHLEQANLRAVQLMGASLSGVHLEEANLEGANLQGAMLRRAYLTGANLAHTNLAEADLRGANFEKLQCRAGDLSCSRSQWH